MTYLFLLIIKQYNYIKILVLYRVYFNNKINIMNRLRFIYYIFNYAVIILF